MKTYKYTVEIETGTELNLDELLKASAAIEIVLPLTQVRINRSVDQLKQKRRRESFERIEHYINKLKNELYHFKKDIEA